MKIRPLHDRILVKRLEEERTTKGGIIIPDTATEKPVQGKVVAVGNGKIMEEGPAKELFANPKSDYTRALFAAAFDLETASADIVAQ